MPDRRVMTIHTEGGIICPKCNRPLESRNTIRPDGVFATCRNEVRKGHGQKLHCGQRFYLMAGPRFVVAVAISPDEFEALTNGNTTCATDVLKALGILDVPLFPSQLRPAA